MKKQKFLTNQQVYADYVKSQNVTLYNALNVEIERTQNTNWIPNWELIASCIPFVNLKSSHIGFAETETINDIHEAFAQLKNVLYVIADNDGSVYPDLYYNHKFAIKRNKERFGQNNAEFSGRILARFNYLLQKNIVIDETKA